MADEQGAVHGYDPAQDYPPEHRPRTGRRILTALVAIAALLGFGVVLVYAYNKGRQDGAPDTPPIIRAKEGPVKVRPDNPGGMKVPDRDKEVFSRLEPGKDAERVERLLPPPEKPMDRPVASIAPEAGTETPDKMAAVGTATTPGKPPTVPPPRASALPPPPPAPLKLEKPADAVEIKPAAAKSKTVPKQVEKKTAKPPVTLAAKTPARTASGRYRVQISSLRSDAAVRKSWSALQKRHRDLLGKLSLNVERKTLGGGKGTYYRMQAGPLSSRSDATGLCNRLKQRKLSCIVVRR